MEMKENNAQKQQHYPKTPNSSSKQKGMKTMV